MVYTCKYHYHKAKEGFEKQRFLDITTFFVFEDVLLTFFPGLGQIWERTPGQSHSRGQTQRASPPKQSRKKLHRRKVGKTHLFNKQSAHKHKERIT